MVNNMNERHPDRESYLYICNELIEKEICNYCDVYKDSLELIPNWKEEIWDKYVQLNRYCKDNYMQEAMGKIDRHKVAACYIIAIASVKPMRFIKKHEKYIAVNESLAITVGFSILRAFFLAMVDEKKSGEERKILIIRVHILEVKRWAEFLLKTDKLFVYLVFLHQFHVAYFDNCQGINKNLHCSCKPYDLEPYISLFRMVVFVGKVVFVADSVFVHDNQQQYNL